MIPDEKVYDLVGKWHDLVKPKFKWWGQFYLKPYHGTPDKPFFEELRNMVVTLSVAAQERKLDSTGIDAVAADPFAAKSEDYANAEFTIDKLGIMVTPSARHNHDFTMVNWFGIEYKFALGVQSSAVKALWGEWEKTGLGLHQETIRQAIDEELTNFRMDTTFRNHPAFRTMIQQVGDGKYMLVELNV